MTSRHPRLLCFGLGYSAMALVRTLPSDWSVIGTSRSAEAAAKLADDGITPVVFDGSGPPDGWPDVLDNVTHVLSSVPPDSSGDPVLRHLGADLARAAGLDWIGYLSTTGVYGDRDGAWVDEDTATAPTAPRGRRRDAAEQDWLKLWREHGRPVHIFRLAGIYGPGRSQLDTVRRGTARRIVKPGQVFGRIHVDDIVQVLRASIDRPRGGGIYNVCDDEPAPPQDVIAFAAELLGLPIPPEVPYEEAELSDMARSFYGENKRVHNDRIKTELGVHLAYPDYRAGLRALMTG